MESLTGKTCYLRNYLPEYQKELGGWHRQQHVQIRVLSASLKEPDYYICQIFIPGEYIRNEVFHFSELITI